MGHGSTAGRGIGVVYRIDSVCSLDVDMENDFNNCHHSELLLL